ncbi:MAG: alpha/beta fold hydrolase [Acidobacteriota bacterium]|nr:alpha/beta fold hydrolase [Acidobacteriota bacterium]
MSRPAYFTLVFALLGGVTVIAQPQVSASDSSTTFNVFLRSTLIGFEQSDVTRSATGWTIRSRGHLAQPVDLRTHLAEIEYDEQWQPVSLRIDGLRNDSPFSLITNFSNNNATSQIEDNGQTRNVTNTISQNAVVLPDYFFAGYEALAQRLKGSAPGDEIPIYVPPRGQTRARVDQTTSQQIETNSGQAIDVCRYLVSFLSDNGPRLTEIWTDGDQNLVRISIPDSAIDATRADITSVGARLRTTSHAGDEDIRIRAAGFALSATVTVPVSQPRPADGWPAVLLIPGPASADRDGTLSGVPVLGQIAGNLAESGFLVARYDRRGVGRSGGRPESSGMNDYADDALSMVKYLDNRKDVNRDRIAVLGHAEGGWTALIAATRERRIDSLVLIGTASTTGAKLVMEQQRAALDKIDASTDERTEKITLQQRILGAVLDTHSWVDIPEHMRRQADTIWFRSFLEFDAAEMFRRTRQPTLILHGAADRHVLPHHAERLNELARSRRDNGSVELVMLDGLDHTLVEGGSDATGPQQSPQPRAVGPSLLAPLTRWLRKAP